MTAQRAKTGLLLRSAHSIKTSIEFSLTALEMEFMQY